MAMLFYTKVVTLWYNITFLLMKIFKNIPEVLLRQMQQFLLWYNFKLSFEGSANSLPILSWLMPGFPTVKVFSICQDSAASPTVICHLWGICGHSTYIRDIPTERHAIRGQLWPISDLLCLFMCIISWQTVRIYLGCLSLAHSQGLKHDVRVQMVPRSVVHGQSYFP